MDSIVRTVTGDIKPSGLGVTYCHDHMAVFSVNGVRVDDRLILDEPGRVLEELEWFKSSGGMSIVDAQPFGAGRNPEVLKYLSEKSGVNIIASTGLHKLSFYPEDFYSIKAGVDELSLLFLSEIEEGMWGYHPADPFKKRTGIRAGLIKIATDSEGLTDYYKKVFRAASIVSVNTGVKIMTHTELGAWAEEQIDFLIGNGVRENSIIISHMDRVIEPHRCKRIAGAGVFLQFDTIHRLKYHSDVEEARLIINLVESGYIENILLGMDSTRERFRVYGACFGLDYILEDFKKILMKMGLGEDGLRIILEKNPARALSFKTVLDKEKSGDNNER